MRITTKGAELGDLVSTYTMAQCYLEGRGVDQDLVKAKKYLSIVRRMAMKTRRQSWIVGLMRVMSEVDLKFKN